MSKPFFVIFFIIDLVMMVGGRQASKRLVFSSPIVSNHFGVTCVCVCVGKLFLNKKEYFMCRFSMRIFFKIPNIIYQAKKKQNEENFKILKFIKT